MQYCPRCGSANQDDRAACWKCFGQLQQVAGRKAQSILLTDRDAPPSAVIPAAPEIEEAPVAEPIQIPELAEPVPEVPIAAPEEPSQVAEELVPVIADQPDAGDTPASDFAIAAPTFEPAVEFEVESEDEEPLSHGVVDLDAPESPVVASRELDAEAPAVEPAAEDELPWWMTQDEQAPETDKESTVLDLDQGLEYTSVDDARETVSFEEAEESDEDPPPANA
ncbi:MAG: hypothetical protein KBC96_00140 [Armatimonadetes bacterium]|nr:hypothetical protein [Armatimonadota bacterium]